MFYSNDPVADYAAYDMDCAKAERALPFCHDCGKALHEGEYIRECGKYFCEDCFALYLDDEGAKS